MALADTETIRTRNAFIARGLAGSVALNAADLEGRNASGTLSVPTQHNSSLILLSWMLAVK